MPGRKPANSAAVGPSFLGPMAGRFAVGTVLGVTAVATVLVLLQLPWALAMPALSIVLVMGGFTLAVGAWLSGLRIVEQGESVGSYEVAGALVFLGFAAALMTDTEQALVLLAQMELPG